MQRVYAQGASSLNPLSFYLLGGSQKNMRKVWKVNMELCGSSRAWSLEFSSEDELIFPFCSEFMVSAQEKISLCERKSSQPQSKLLFIWSKTFLDIIKNTYCYSMNLKILNAAFFNSTKRFLKTVLSYFGKST